MVIIREAEKWYMRKVLEYSFKIKEPQIKKALEEKVLKERQIAIKLSEEQLKREHEEQILYYYEEEL